MSRQMNDCSCCCSCSNCTSNYNNRTNRSNVTNNNQQCTDHPIVPNSKKMHTVSGYDVQRLIHKIKRVRSYLPSINSIPILDFSNKECRSVTNDDRPPKHIGQIESIVSHMQRNGLLPPPSSRCNDMEIDTDDNSTMTTTDDDFYYIEFGCGTAKLSDHLSMTIMKQQQQVNHNVTSNDKHVRFILIDQQPIKAVERYCDGRIRSRHYEQQQQTNDKIDVVQRFTCPIAHIQLSDILHPENGIRPTRRCTVVAMAKHLCGSATDDAIQSVQTLFRDGTKTTTTTTPPDDTDDDGDTHLCIGTPTKKKKPISTTVPLVIATCCHYACDANTLMEYSFPRPAAPSDAVHGVPPTDCRRPLSYLQYMGLEERDVEVLLIVSQWASIKVDVATVDAPADGDNVVRVAERSPPNEASPIVPLSLFHVDSLEGDDGSRTPVAGALPDRRDGSAWIDPPVLPPHPIPTTIPVEIETNLRQSSKLFEDQFSRQEKYELGRYSKLLIDLTRAYYLKYNDISPYKNVQLVYYTALSVECQLLIATSR